MLDPTGRMIGRKGASAIGKKSVFPPISVSEDRLQLETLRLLTINFNVLVEPTATLPKSRLARLTLTAQLGEAGAPRPESAPVVGPALEKIVAVPAADPPDGVKRKLRLTAAPDTRATGSDTAGKLVKSVLPVKLIALM